MRFLADENVPRSLVRELRRLGHDVTWISEDSPAVEDPVVLDLAKRESRLLITLDKDFGELSFRTRRAGTTGIVLLRLPSSPRIVRESFLRLIDSDIELAGQFTVLEMGRVRQRPLPSD